MTVKAQKPIVIFRGDNTAAFDLRTITILLTGDLDLTNATARFDLLGFTKSWTAEEVATGELSIVFDSAQTKAFALGPQTGTLRLFDMSTGTPRQLTVVNKIPFFVTNNVCEIDSQSYGVNVRVSGGDVIHIEFKVGARAVEGKADKVKNATTGDLASLTPDGNLEDSGIPKTDVLRKTQMDSAPTEGSSNPVTSDGIKRAIDAATPSDYAEVKAQVAANTGDIAEIESLIPAQASAQNQLADKQFVNSSIATNTANFLGTFDYTTDLDFPQPASSADVSDAAIATALASLAFPQTPTNNDYVFVQIDYSATTPADEFRRFKFNGTAWAYEYTLNNSSFTADQWAAINSGITSGAVEKLGALPTAQELATALAAKYEKPAGGIPASDLADGEQYHFYDAQVEYVYFGGSQYVLLPTRTLGTAKIGFELGATYERGGDTQLLGMLLDSVRLFQLLPSYNHSQILDIPKTSGYSARISGSAPTASAFHEWKYKNGTFTVDDTTVGTYDNQAVEYPTNGNLGVFARCTNDGVTVSGIQKGNFYYLKIYNGNTLLYDLVPVRVGTAGCLYDKVGKRIYFPAEGALSCGADVATTPMNRKYDKPSSGIPASDMASAVQASLDKADTALQTAPVTSVNNKTGAVSLAASDVGAVPTTGGTMTGRLHVNGSLDVDYTENGVTASIFRVTGSSANPTRFVFYDGSPTRKTIYLSDIAALSDIGIPAFSTAKTYALNAKVVYDNAIWNCTTAVLSAGAWTGTTNWTKLFGLAVDSAPTANSKALVTSGDIKTAMDAKAPLASPAFTGTPTAPTPTAGDNSTNVATTAFVKTAIGGITPGPDNTKLDATSAAPAFSTTSTYAVDEHVTYNGKLYRCTTAVTVAGAWDASKWTADTMTDPDAVLDITSQNQLRIVAKDGTLLWAQGYDLASTSSATLACDAVNNFTFADGATSQAFALPTAPTGKVGDFILDIDNSANTGAATMTLTGLDTTFSASVQKGESLTDMLSIAAGELARFYITLTTFRINNLPTWQIVKQVVENGGATV